MNEASFVGITLGPKQDAVTAMTLVSCTNRLICCLFSGYLTPAQYADLSEEEVDSKAGLVAGEAARISQFYSLLTSSIDVIYKFCDRIPGFNDLCKQDRDLLFRSACLELFTLRLSHR